MTTAGAPSGRSGHTAVWTGRSMIVWGGGPGLHLDSGGIYYGTGDMDQDRLDNACDPDLDGDGIANDADCAPEFPGNPMAPVGDSLGLTQELGATLLSWHDGGLPGPFGVHRGTRDPGLPWWYDHPCVHAAVERTLWEDPLDPPPGGLFYYLVGRLGGVCGESALGFDSGGKEIPNAAPCTIEDPPGSH